MSDDNKPRPRVFGERGSGEPLPFGSRPRRTDDAPAPQYRDAAPRYVDPPLPDLADDLSYSPTPDKPTNGSTPAASDAPTSHVRRAHVTRSEPETASPRPPMKVMLAIVSVGFTIILIVMWSMRPRTVIEIKSHTNPDISAFNTLPPTTPTVDPLAPPGVTPQEAKRIGIASGHRGINPENGLPDPGSVCADGLTEQSVVENISFRVAALLQAQGYTVEIIDKWDARLPGYSALTLVAIHADSCDYINDEATGFKVASYVFSSVPEQDARLVGCLNSHYEAATGLAQHPGSITPAMTEHYVFRLIDPMVPAAIIEVGFLYLDREVITTRAYDSAYGIAQGILCYLEGEPPQP